MKIRSQAYALLSAFVVSLSMLLGGCAGQQAPQGGPVDTEPPVVVSVYPAPNTVGFRDNRIALEFNKYVDRASVEKAVFISPYASNIEFDWSGREVEIVFNDGLKKNTTYVLTLGTDVVELNAHNRLAHAFTLAFSTGGFIDRGAVDGRLYDEKTDGVMVFAYRLDELRADTLNAARTKPDYITQIGAAGTFSLTHLRFGTYRLFAVRDEYRDLLYTPEVDAAGTLTHDVTLNDRDTSASACNFTLALEDTSAPRLLTVEARDRRHLELKFSEPLDTAHVAPEMIKISDTLTQRPIHVAEVFFTDPLNPTTLVARLQQETAAAAAGYRMKVDSVRDRVGHRILSSTSMLTFSSSDKPDTTSPHLIASSVRDTVTRVFTDEHFRFDFSDALTPSIRHAFTFRLNDSASVPFTLAPTGVAGVVLTPDRPLIPKSKYVIRLQYDSVRSLSGFALKDSMRVFRYTTIDPENFSSIDGRIAGTALSDTSRTIVEALNVADKTAVVHRVTVRTDKTFSFPLLPEGTYALRAFSDENKNGVLDAGRVYPFRPSEPFIVGRDTIKVRARWPVEGAVIR